MLGVSTSSGFSVNFRHARGSGPAHIKLRFLLSRFGEKLHQLFEFQARQLVSIDRENLIAGGEARLRRRRSLHGLQNDHAAGQHADDASEAFALALLHLLELLKLAGIEENRMRVERFEHARNRALIKGLIGRQQDPPLRDRQW